MNVPSFTLVLSSSIHNMCFDYSLCVLILHIDPPTHVSLFSAPSLPFFPLSCVLALRCISWSSSAGPLSVSHQLCVEAPFSPMRQSGMNRRAYSENSEKSQSLPLVSLSTSLYSSPPVLSSVLRLCCDQSCLLRLLLLAAPTVSHALLSLRKMCFNTEIEHNRSTG